MHQPDDLPKPVLDALRHIGVEVPTRNPIVAELLHKHEDSLRRKRERRARYKKRDRERREAIERRASERAARNAELQRKRNYDLSLIDPVEPFARYQGRRRIVVPFARARGYAPSHSNRRR